jgi:eukaryotic-like serine/threonine-protein kinase
VEIREQWSRIKEIVGAALEREQSERGAFLDQACLDDRQLRAEIESLLAAHADAGVLSQAAWTTTLSEPAGEPETIGSYRLIRELGVGGMGQVWLAEQTEPVRRRIALKLIKAGMYDAATVQRFQAERQSLAIMEHPAIAKVFDAGATPQGQPYFAMEYVDGAPITTYCDRKKLGIQERLRLFIQVCEGVQHAHQKAIIHRDLKPSNILVTEIDRKSTPRIIDFGLAKATVPRLGGDASFTHVGAFLGTPGYMSPEQVDPNLHDVDTRTDVYSLGVVLYELLTGDLPFDTKRWKQQNLDEVLRQLRETDPQRPSTKISTSRQTSTARADARNTEPRQLVSQLRGDLDWIALKALEKDRERRYATPAALAADIECYLDSRPVMARPASRAYRFRKYILRHRAGVVVMLGAVIVLLAFVAAQSLELRRTKRERDRADRITQFMTGMFKVSNPSEARGNTITAREILDKSSKEIETGLAKDAELQAQMLDVTGEVYGNLGLYGRAHELFAKAIEINRRALGPNHPSTLTAMDHLGWNLVREGHFPEAEKLLRQTLDLRRRVLGAEKPDTLYTMNNLASALDEEGRYPEAEALVRDTLERRQRVLGKEDPNTVISMTGLAVILLDEGHNAAAETIEKQALEILRRTLGPENPRTLIAMGDLGVILSAEGHEEQAEKIKRETLEIERRVFGPEHPNTLRLMINLGSTLQKEHRFPEAEQILEDALEIELRVLGREHAWTLSTMNNLVNTFNKQGRWQEGEKLGRETLEIRRKVLGPEHRSTLLSMGNLASSLMGEGRYAEAEKLQRETLETQRQRLGPEHPDTAESVYNLAVIEEHAGHRDEALKLLRQAIEHGLPVDDAMAMADDPSINSLHGDPRFAQLVVEAKARAAAVGNPSR